MEICPCVFHVDIDAFFASVEELRNPRLVGRPVAVGTGVIASCNYEARRFSLQAGMPLREARRRCPKLVILEGHYPIYRCFAEKVFDLCREYAPAIECHLDEAFCDMTGTQKLYGFQMARHSGPETAARGGSGRGGARGGGVPQVARELVERIGSQVGLSVSLGIGRNRMVAKMASKSAKPGGLRQIEPGQEEAFISPLPIRLLPGIGPRTAAVLEKLNLQTIGEMRTLCRESLKAIFGQNGALLYERCRGEDTRAIGRREIPRSISRETSFHEDQTVPEEIEGMLHYLSERAANTLRKLGLKTRRVEVKLRYADHQEVVGGRSLPAPTQIDEEIFETALALRRSLHTRRVALRLVGVALSRLSPDDGTHELDLFGGVCGVVPASPLHRPRGDGLPGTGGEDAGSRREDLVEEVLEGLERRRRALSLCRSLDRLRERFGYSAVVSGKSLHLLGKLPQDAYGYILRTPSLTR
jgi:DNA polymerase-4